MPTSPPNLARPLRTVSALTLISRILGLVRDLVTVRIFGDTAVGSAFAAAFAIPNVFRRLFGEGALSAAFLPAYSRLNDADPPTAAALARHTLLWLALVTGALTVLAEVALLAVILLTPDDATRDLSLGLVMATLPFMPLVCAAAILGGMLQVHDKFAPLAAAPIILNLCLIAVGGMYFLLGRGDPVPWAYALAAAAVAAGVLQVLWSLAALRAHARRAGARGEQARAQSPDSDPSVRTAAPAVRAPQASVRTESRALFRRFLPAVLGLGTLQINSLIDTLVAMWPVWVGPTILGYTYPLDEASNAILFYSQRLYQFPLGVFGIAVATVAFPELARAAAKDRTPGHDPLAETLRRGLRLSLFVGLPATIGLWLVSQSLVTTVLTGGDGFTADGAARATAVLQGYAVAIWAYSVNHVLTRAFYAAEDTVTPVRIAAAFVGVNLVLNLLLIWYLREAGMAWATAISAVGQTVFLALALKARHLHAQLFDKESLTTIGKMVLCSAVMGVGVWLVLEAIAPGPDWTSHALALAAATVGGAGVYAAVAARFGLPELAELLGRVKG